jgi:hypothetical protein
LPRPVRRQQRQVEHLQRDVGEGNGHAEAHAQGRRVGGGDLAQRGADCVTIRPVGAADRVKVERRFGGGGAHQQRDRGAVGQVDAGAVRQARRRVVRECRDRKVERRIEDRDTPPETQLSAPMGLGDRIPEWARRGKAQLPLERS